MSYFPLTPEQRDWKARIAEIAEQDIAPHAAEIDKARRYPTVSLNALKREGLWGLRVAKEHGGLGADLLTTCLIVEEIAKRCPGLDGRRKDGRACAFSLMMSASAYSRHAGRAPAAHYTLSSSWPSRRALGRANFST